MSKLESLNGVVVVLEDGTLVLDGIFDLESLLRLLLAYISHYDTKPSEAYGVLADLVEESNQAKLDKIRKEGL